MNVTGGSSKLDNNQSDHTKKLFGVRYLHIQTDASTASRKERRRRGQRGTLGCGSLAVPRG